MQYVEAEQQQAVMIAHILDSCKRQQGYQKSENSRNRDYPELFVYQAIDNTERNQAYKQPA